MELNGNIIREAPEKFESGLWQSASMKDNLSYAKALALVRFLAGFMGDHIRINEWGALSKDGADFIVASALKAVANLSEPLFYCAEVQVSGKSPEVVTLGLIWNQIVNGPADPVTRLVSVYQAINPGASFAEAVWLISRVRSAAIAESIRVIEELMEDSRRAPAE